MKNHATLKLSRYVWLPALLLLGCEAVLDPQQDREDPVCSAWIELEEGLVIASTDLGAEASDDGTVIQVVFRIDGRVVGVDHQAPWSQGWNPARWRDGQVHQLDVVAIDASGKAGYSPVREFRVGAGEFPVLWQPFESRVGGSLEEYTHGLAVLADGTVYTAGASRPGRTTPFAASLARLDREGDPLWHRRFGGQHSDALFALAPDGQGNLWGAGASFQSPWLLVLDPEGGTLISRFHPTPGVGAYTALLPLGDGWLAPGSTWDGTQGDWFLDRLDSRGELLDRQVYSTTDRSEHLMGACRLRDGSLCLAGWCSDSTGTYALLRCHAPGGALLAERTVLSSRALAVVGWGDAVVVCGQLEQGGRRRAWLECLGPGLDPRGSFLAEPESDTALAGVAALGDRLLAVGWSRIPGAGERLGLVMAFDARAGLLDHHTLDGHGDASLRTLALHPEGGLILAGQTTGAGNGRFDHWILHTDAAGRLPVELWATRP